MAASVDSAPLAQATFGEPSGEICVRVSFGRTSQHHQHAPSAQITYNEDAPRTSSKDLRIKANWCEQPTVTAGSVKSDLHVSDDDRSYCRKPRRRPGACSSMREGTYYTSQSYLAKTTFVPEVQNSYGSDSAHKCLGMERDGVRAVGVRKSGAGDSGNRHVESRRANIGGWPQAGDSSQPPPTKTLPYPPVESPSSIPALVCQCEDPVNCGSTSCTSPVLIRTVSDADTTTESVRQKCAGGHREDNWTRRSALQATDHAGAHVHRGLSQSYTCGTGTLGSWHRSYFDITQMRLREELDDLSGVLKHTVDKVLLAASELIPDERSELQLLLGEAPGAPLACCASHDQAPSALPLKSSWLDCTCPAEHLLVQLMDAIAETITELGRIPNRVALARSLIDPYEETALAESVMAARRVQPPSLAVDDPHFAQQYRAYLDTIRLPGSHPSFISPAPEFLRESACGVQRHAETAPGSSQSSCTIVANDKGWDSSDLLSPEALSPPSPPLPNTAVVEVQDEEDEGVGGSDSEGDASLEQKESISASGCVGQPPSSPSMPLRGSVPAPSRQTPEMSLCRDAWENEDPLALQASSAPRNSDTAMLFLRGASCAAEEDTTGAHYESGRRHSVQFPVHSRSRRHTLPQTKCSRATSGGEWAVRDDGSCTPGKVKVVVDIKELTQRTCWAAKCAPALEARNSPHNHHQPPAPRNSKTEAQQSARRSSRQQPPSSEEQPARQCASRDSVRSSKAHSRGLGDREVGTDEEPPLVAHATKSSKASQAQEERPRGTGASSGTRRQHHHHRPSVVVTQTTSATSRGGGDGVHRRHRRRLRSSSASTHCSRRYATAPRSRRTPAHAHTRRHGPASPTTRYFSRSPRYRHRHRAPPSPPPSPPPPPPSASTHYGRGDQLQADGNEEDEDEDEDEYLSYKDMEEGSEEEDETSVDELELEEEEEEGEGEEKSSSCGSYVVDSDTAEGAYAGVSEERRWDCDQALSSQNQAADVHDSRDEVPGRSSSENHYKELTPPSSRESSQDRDNAHSLISKSRPVAAQQVVAAWPPGRHSLFTLPDISTLVDVMRTVAGIGGTGGAASTACSTSAIPVPPHSSHDYHRIASPSGMHSAGQTGGSGGEAMLLFNHHRPRRDGEASDASEEGVPTSDFSSAVGSPRAPLLPFLTSPGSESDVDSEPGTEAEEPPALGPADDPTTAVEM